LCDPLAGLILVAGEMVDQRGEAAGLKWLIVVLDGDLAVRDSLTFLLTIEGFEVRSYASSMELLNDNDLPARYCLIVDSDMPEVDGLGVVEELRERKNCSRAILVTSRPNDAIRDRAAKLGVPVVVKPFRGTELIDAVHTLRDRAPIGRLGS
jgi:two-component system, LuxR family, response regulator FixJ